MDDLHFNKVGLFISGWILIAGILISAVDVYNQFHKKMADAPSTNLADMVDGHWMPLWVDAGCRLLAAYICLYANVYAHNNLEKIKASRWGQRNSEVGQAVFSILSLSLATITFYSAPKTDIGVGISFVFVVWGWLFDLSLEMATPCEILPTTMAISHGFILELAKEDYSKLYLVCYLFLLTLVLRVVGTFICPKRRRVVCTCGARTATQDPIFSAPATQAGDPATQDPHFAIQVSSPNFSSRRNSPIVSSRRNSPIVSSRRNDGISTSWNPDPRGNLYHSPDRANYHNSPERGNHRRQLFT